MVLSLIQKTILKFLGVFSAVIVLFLIGTFAYHQLEGWSYVDSFYFTGVTLTTVGYGDLHPTTDASKIFTVLFALAGIGVILASLTFLGQYFLHHEKEFKEKYKNTLKNKVEKHNAAVKRLRNELVKHSRH